VQVNPIALNDKLGVHVLLLDWLTAERWKQELEDAYVPNLRLDHILEANPRRIAGLPDHVSALLTVLTLFCWFNVHRDIEVLLFINHVEVTVAAIGLHLLLRNYKVIRGKRNRPGCRRNGEADSPLVRGATNRQHRRQNYYRKDCDCMSEPGGHVWRPQFMAGKGMPG